MYCRNCGEELRDGARFCPNCGARVTDAGPAKAGAQDAATGEDAPSGTGGAAAASQKPPKPSGPATDPARRRRRVIGLVVGIAAVAAVVLLVGHLLLGGESTEGTKDTSIDPSLGQDFEVGDVEVGTWESQPCLRCTIVNTSDQVARNVSFSISAIGAAKNWYGDAEDVDLAVEVINAENGSSNTIDYLFPGENEVTFIPKTRSGVVARYGSEDDAETYTFDDLADFSVELAGYPDLPADEYVRLSDDDYQIDTQLAETGGDKVLDVSVTNSTDYRWGDVTVHLVAVDEDGALADTAGGTSTEADLIYNIDAYDLNGGNAVAMQDLGPGETQSTSVGYSEYLDVDHFEVLGVYVRKDLDTGSDSCGSR